YDSGVRDPWVITAADGTQHMWFSGFDGDIWQIGYATRASDTAEWQSAEDSEGSPRAVLPALLGSFGASGLLRPVVRPTDTGWSLYLTGVDSGIERVGEALGRSPDRLVRRLHQPSLADSLGFQAVPASGQSSLLLDVQVDAGLLMALGCTDTNLDEERGFLYISCRLVPEVVVVDIRDDSTPTFVDQNYLQVESVVIAETSSTGGKTGWRSAVRDPQRDWLWGLGDAPEALQAIDLSDIPDNAGLELVRRPFVAMLALPRSGDRDQGAETEAWVGPSDAVVHPDGKTLFVANFNDNSLSVFDLSLGPVGTLVGEVANLGENPYAITLTPDGKRAIVACYAGEVDDATVHSTLAVVDTDPESPTYLSTLTHIVNQEQTP
ncbi:MAG TPA: beta-propeller fold lactonase family protein, partial [Myxococcota bacterium]|nr:beta-propeller fold lactonase family protein [Myxococcota bacterium]